MNKILAMALAGGVFAGGLMAPDSWRQAVQVQVDKVTGAASTQSKPAVDVQPAVAKDSPPPVDFTAVQRPLALPAGSKLGLGLGMFTSPVGGADRAARVTALGYVTQFVALKDENEAVWYLLVVGSYGSEEDAERQQAVLANQLSGKFGAGVRPEIVLIPPLPKK